MNYSIDKLYVLNNKILLEHEQVYDSIPLKNYILDNSLELFLYNKDGRIKQYFSLSECEEIIKLNNLKNNTPLQQQRKLEMISLKLSNVISDLLGINIRTNPRTRINKDGINDIVVSAKKSNLFRERLVTYIYLSLISDKILELNNNDYRILLALKKANIKCSCLPEFTIVVDKNGEIKINKQELGLQKVIKL